MVIIPFAAMPSEFIKFTSKVGIITAVVKRVKNGNAIDGQGDGATIKRVFA
jgi:hypothetical protein